MKLNRILAVIFSLFLLASISNAQKTEITVTLNEQFFDALLDAIFQHAGAPEFPLALKETDSRDASEVMENAEWRMENKTDESRFSIVHTQFSIFPASSSRGREVSQCKETIRLQRESNGVRTAVRFRDGKVLAPLAFTGSYSPPFVGCVDFAGWAETKIDIEFDENGQRLVARAKVLNVSLNGAGGIGGTVIARMVQSAIDKKINPIEIVRLDKLSFGFPVQNGANLRMKAVGIRNEISNGAVNVHIAFEFLKG